MLSTAADLLIFDCDGVLIDSEPVASRVLWQALTRSGVTISLKDVHHRFVGYSEADARRICIDELGASEPDRIFAEARDNLYTEFRKSLAPMAAGMTAIGFVDPADTRPGRAEVLAKAGAIEVVTGAAGLAALLLNGNLTDASARPSSRSSPAPALA